MNLRLAWAPGDTPSKTPTSGAGWYAGLADDLELVMGKVLKTGQASATDVPNVTRHFWECEHKPHIALCIGWERRMQCEFFVFHFIFTASLRTKLATNSLSVLQILNYNTCCIPFTYLPLWTLENFVEKFAHRLHGHGQFFLDFWKTLWRVPQPIMSSYGRGRCGPASTLWWISHWSCEGAFVTWKRLKALLHFLYECHF